MQDAIIEEILRAPSLKERARTIGRHDSTIPPANRYPRSSKRAELERGRQPWAKQPFPIPGRDMRHVTML